MSVVTEYKWWLMGPNGEYLQGRVSDTPPVAMQPGDMVSGDAVSPYQHLVIVRTDHATDGGLDASSVTHVMFVRTKLPGADHVLAELEGLQAAAQPETMVSE